MLFFTTRHLTLRVLIKQIQLVFRDINISRHFIFVCRDKTFDIPLYQFDGGRFAGLAVIAQRAILTACNTESQKLFLGQGFEQCGQRKDWIRTAERYIDVYEYQLINKE